MNKIALLFAAVIALISCDKTSNEEGFDKKLKIEVGYWNTSGTRINQSTDLAISAKSGTNLTFYYSIGGEEGFRNKTVAEMVQSFHLVTTNSRGTDTCTFVPDTLVIGSYSVSIPVRESASYSFILTSTAGEKAVVGPIAITAVNTQEVYMDIVTCSATNLFAPGNPNLASPYIYNSNTIDQFYPGYPVFAAVESGGQTYLVSPTRFQDYGVATSYLAQYECGYRATRFMPYTGSLTLDDFTLSNNTHTYSDLNGLTLTNPQETLQVVAGERFIFETAEGRKGIGKFSSNQSAGGTSFVFEFQK